MQMSHVTHVNESCHTQQRVMSHPTMSPVTHMSKTESRAREEWVTWFMSHVLQKNESCHTQQRVTSHILARLSRARERIGSEHASTSKSQQQNERESEREVLHTVLYYDAPIHVTRLMYTGGKSYTKNEQESEKEVLHIEREREVLHTIYCIMPLNWNCIRDKTHVYERESAREVLHTKTKEKAKGKSYTQKVRGKSCTLHCVMTLNYIYTTRAMYTGEKARD